MQSRGNAIYSTDAEFSGQLPSQHRVDYDAPLSAAPPTLVCLIPYLREVLPPLWRDAYLKSTFRQANLLHLHFGRFEYICDVYSDLEARGEIAYDQTVQDRVVVAFGTSGRECLPAARRSARWIDADEQLTATERDHGHLIARCLGGSGLQLNVFSQDRRLNRGRSVPGKVYRQMEIHCAQQPGTFCFSRPIYNDNSCVPRWLEFGVLKADQALWVETFDN